MIKLFKLFEKVYDNPIENFPEKGDYAICRIYRDKAFLQEHIDFIDNHIGQIVFATKLTDTSFFFDVKYENVPKNLIKIHSGQDGVVDERCVRRFDWNSFKKEILFWSKDKEEMQDFLENKDIYLSGRKFGI